MPAISACGTVREDVGRIPKRPKSADFGQKAWATAHGFKDGGFSLVPEIVPNSLKCPHMLANGFLIDCGTVLEDFGRIPKGPKSADFDQKAHGFVADFGKCRKSSQTP